MFLSYASVRVRVFSIVCFLCFEVFTTVLLSSDNLSSNLPIVINTWKFTNATTAAWRTLTDGKHNALDALVEGCSTCEREQCDGTVGYGGSPDEEGGTALDAMIMDGSNMNMGAVANLRNVKNAIGVARHVLINTRHSLLVGDQATDFALQMGFKKENLSTENSIEIWNKWRSKNCQPNFWENVSPDPKKFCGPYRSIETEKCTKTKYSDCDDNLKIFGKYNHDTIGMIVIDENGRIFVGTSTNGANHKIPGRVGDSPIPGAGAYANNDYGAAAATGDGDVMMRFLPSFQAVQYLKDDLTPKDAATKSIQSIIRYHPKFFGGIIVINKAGEYSAACTGMKKFPFSVYKSNYVDAQVEYVDCINVD